jgi:hypothetical protein
LVLLDDVTFLMDGFFLISLFIFGGEPIPLCFLGANQTPPSYQRPLIILKPIFHTNESNTQNQQTERTCFANVQKPPGPHAETPNSIVDFQESRTAFGGGSSGAAAGRAHGARASGCVCCRG